MTVYELLSVNSEVLKKLHVNGVRISDYKYVEIYKRYLEMVESGEKVSYIVSNLASLYEVGERTGLGGGGSGGIPADRK